MKIYYAIFIILLFRNSTGLSNSLSEIRLVNLNDISFCNGIDNLDIESNNDTVSIILWKSKLIRLTKIVDDLEFKIQRSVFSITDSTIRTNLDSLYHTKKMISSIITNILQHPKFSYDNCLKILEKAGVICLQSKDKKISTYSWCTFSNIGGYSEYHFKSYVQFINVNDKVRTVFLPVYNNSLYDSIYEPTNIYKIIDIEINKKKCYMICCSYTVENILYTFVQVLSFDNSDLIRIPCFSDIEDKNVLSISAHKSARFEIEYDHNHKILSYNDYQLTEFGYLREREKERIKYMLINGIFKKITK